MHIWNKSHGEKRNGMDRIQNLCAIVTNTVLITCMLLFNTVEVCL